MVDFTKENGRNAKDALDEIMDDMGKDFVDYAPHFNEALVFIDRAIANAPEADSE